MPTAATAAVTTAAVAAAVPREVAGNRRTVGRLGAFVMHDVSVLVCDISPQMDSSLKSVCSSLAKR